MALHANHKSVGRSMLPSDRCWVCSLGMKEGKVKDAEKNILVASFGWLSAGINSLQLGLGIFQLSKPPAIGG